MAYITMPQVQMLYTFPNQYLGLEHEVGFADDNDNHNLSEDSLGPENDFDYSGYQDNLGPW